MSSVWVCVGVMIARGSRVLGSLTSEVEKAKDEGGEAGETPTFHLPSHAGEPAPMHFNESALYTTGSGGGDLRARKTKL